MQEDSIRGALSRLLRVHDGIDFASSTCAMFVALFHDLLCTVVLGKHCIWKGVRTVLTNFWQHACLD